VVGSGDHDGNEVSSSQPGAAGTVPVLEVSCEPVPTLRVEFDPTLGSDVDRGPWTSRHLGLTRRPAEPAVAASTKPRTETVDRLRGAEVQRSLKSI